MWASARNGNTMVAATTRLIYELTHMGDLEFCDGKVFMVGCKARYNALEMGFLVEFCS